MHELSIAQSVVERAASVAREEHAHRVTGITLTVGALAGVDPEALQMAFSVAAEGTALEGAALVIEFVPAVLRCGRCGREWICDYPEAICGVCASTDVHVRAGQELILKSIDLE